MSTIREALNTYPLAKSLRRGVMDLRPSLAKHLERETAKPAADPGEPVRRLIVQLDELIEGWRRTAEIINDPMVLACANELDQLLNEGKP